LDREVEAIHLDIKEPSYERREIPLYPWGPVVHLIG